MDELVMVRYFPHTHTHQVHLAIENITCIKNIAAV